MEATDITVGQLVDILEKYGEREHLANLEKALDTGRGLWRGGSYTRPSRISRSDTSVRHLVLRRLREGAYAQSVRIFNILNPD